MVALPNPDPDEYEDTIPTVSDWLHYGYRQGAALETWPGKIRYHRCGSGLEVAIIYNEQEAEIRFIVACYPCGLYWPTGLRASGMIGNTHYSGIADIVAIRAALKLQQESDDENQGKGTTR